jgi:tRNA A-37 threonylcarbamoyl transferase component Bud32
VRVSSDPRIGTRIVGYRIESLLGRGGMSVVYRAVDEMLERNVVLKFLASELAEDEHFRDRFLRESRLAAAIEHPNIVPVYDAGDVDGQLYIAMRYVEGTDLKELLRQESLPPARALAIVEQVARALDTAHARRLVHRDVKPSNILVAEGDHAYLADFGLTKLAADRADLTATGQIMGTIDYIAPEQIEGKDVDARADVYALGCVLYECLTGAPPFPRSSELAVLWAHVNDAPPKPSERRPELAAPIDAVLAKALAKDPHARYATCAELVEAARTALSPPQPERRRPRRRVVAGAALSAIAAAAAAFLLLRGGDDVAPLTTVDSLAYVDAGTNRLAASIALEPGANGVALLGGNAWVTRYAEESAYIVDGDTKRVLGTNRWATSTTSTIRVPTTITTGARKAWVGFDCCRVVAVPLDGYGSLDQIPLTPPGEAVGTAAEAATASAFGADGVWVATLDDRLWRIDPHVYPLRVAASIAVPGHVSDIVAGPRGVWLSTTNGLLVRVDPATNRIARVIRPGFAPSSLAMGFGSLWVLDAGGHAVREFDLGASAFVRRIATGADPVDLAIGAGGVWLSDGRDGTISRIDPRSRKVVATTKVGPRADDLAVGNGAVWVIAHPR